LEASDIQRDLLLLRCPPEQIERVGKFLEALSQVKERVFMDDMRHFQENAVLPTLDDVDVVCDVRAVFEDHPYPLAVAERIDHTTAVKSAIGTRGEHGPRLILRIRVFALRTLAAKTCTAIISRRVRTDNFMRSLLAVPTRKLTYA
jgi:hypothetical protein